MNSRRFCSLPFRRLSHSLSDARLTFIQEEIQGLRSLSPVTAGEPPTREAAKGEAAASSRRVEISHRWPEWAELMEILFIKGYLDPAAFEGPSNSNLIRTASLNFARDRSDLIR